MSPESINIKLLKDLLLFIKFRNCENGELRQQTGFV